MIIKPILIAVVVYYCLRFLVMIIDDNGPERFFTVVLLVVMIVGGMIYLVLEFLKNIWLRFYNKLSARNQAKIQIASKLLDYVSILLLGALLYKFWLKDSLLASFFIALLLIDRLYTLIKKSRSVNPS